MEGTGLTHSTLNRRFWNSRWDADLLVFYLYSTGILLVYGPAHSYLHLHSHTHTYTHTRIHMESTAVVEESGSLLPPSLLLNWWSRTTPDIPLECLMGTSWQHADSAQIPWNHQIQWGMEHMANNHKQNWRCMQCLLTFLMARRYTSRVVAVIGPQLGRCNCTSRYRVFCRGL